MDFKKSLRFISLLVIVIGILAMAPSAFAAKKIKVTSPAFKNGGDIAAKYAYNGFDIPGAENLSIPLNWKVTKKVANKTKSFAVTIIDLHPIAQKFVHLLAFDIPADTRALSESMLSGDMTTAPFGTRAVINTAGFSGYVGPYPPPNEGRHVYEITVYALNVEKLELDYMQQISLGDFRKLLKKKVVAKGVLKGKFGYTTEETSGMDTMGSMDDPRPPEPVTVEITSAGFSPSTVNIKFFGSVKFVNKDTETHWPASDPHPVHTDYPVSGGCIGSEFDACKALAQNEEWQFVFLSKGTFGYHDHLNPGLKGTVVVE